MLDCKQWWSKCGCCHLIITGQHSLTGMKQITTLVVFFTSADWLWTEISETLSSNVSSRVLFCTSICEMNLIYPWNIASGMSGEANISLQNAEWTRSRFAYWQRMQQCSIPACCLFWNTPILLRPHCVGVVKPDSCAITPQHTAKPIYYRR